MRKLVAALLLYLGLASAALAQTTFKMPPPAGTMVLGVQVVNSCGAANISVPAVAYLVMDHTGVLCTSSGGGGGGLSVQDGATFTAGTSNFTPSGGEYNATPTTLASGAQGTLALNQYRSAYVDVMTSNNALYSAITSPVPCKAAATWNASTGLTGTSPAGCDGSAALWSDIGATGGVALGVNTAPTTTTPNVPVAINCSVPSAPCITLGQTTKSASVPVVVASDQLGSQTPANSLPVIQSGYTYTHITTATTTAAIKTGAGMLHTVCVNSLGTVASSITVDDALTATTPTIAVINSLTLLGCQTYDVAFTTGLTLVTTGTVAPDVTVSWR